MSDFDARAAVEQIRGQALPQDWPEAALAAGTRVVVIQDAHWPGPWQREFGGTISDLAAPEPVLSSKALPNELSYWVDFDEGQYDADGEGPFRGGQIWGRYVRPETPR